MEIGKKIQYRRKLRNMTQEKLADRLGVSTPAISKWETGSSYPDIQLLPPIARALGCTVDELLSFDSRISEEDLKRIRKEVRKKAEEEGYFQGMELMKKYLCEYSNSNELKMEAVTLAHMLIYTIKGEYKEEDLKKYLGGMRTYCDEVAQSDDPQYSQVARMWQFNHYMGEQDYEKAEEVLNKIPAQLLEVDQLRATLLIEKGEYGEAENILQRSMYENLQKTALKMSCLSTVMIKTGKLEKADFYLDGCIRLGELFGGVMSLFAWQRKIDLYLEREEEEAAYGCLIRYIEELTEQNYNVNDNPYFETVKLSVQSEPGQLKGTKRMMLQVLQVEPKYDIFKGRKEYQEAVQKLEAQIESL